MSPKLHHITAYAEFELENGILTITFMPMDITLAIAKEIVQTRIEYSAGQSYPGLADVRKVRGIDREAREYFSSDEARVGVIAGALLIDSQFSSSIANFFLKVTLSKPKIPTRIFSKKEKALSWLSGFVTEP